MKTILLKRDFFFSFFPGSTQQPIISHLEDFGEGDEAQISYEDAKEMIAALQNFVKAVDEEEMKRAK